MFVGERSAFLRYAIALSSVAVAFALRLVLDPVLGDYQPVATFYLAVLISSWYGGLRPGLLATFSGFLLADWFFVPPRHSLLISFARHWIALTVFLVVGGTIAYVIDSLQRSRQRAEQATHDALLRQQTLEKEVEERSRTEEALRESEGRLQLALAAGRMGAWDWDISTNRIAWSPGLEEIHGLRPGAFGGQFEDFKRDIHPDHVESVLAAIETALKTRSEYYLAYRIRRPDGAVRWLETFGKVLAGSGGEPDKMAGICMDITERKEAELELAGLKDRLEARIRERTAELVESNRALEGSNRALEAEIRERKQLEREILEVSEREQKRVGQDLHDGLSQLLRGVAYLSQVLQENLAKRSLPEAQDATRITQLINEAMAHARGLALGLFPVKMEADGLMAALAELAANVENIYKVTCQFECPGPVLIQDNNAAIHLYRIAQEAVSNALQHAHASRISISVTGSVGAVRLTIDDNGQGMPRDAERRQGMGLRIMDYRARTIGALLKSRRVPGGGTSVTCSWRSDHSRPTE